jgi:putative colanic acid biosynthesis glycosyltransferase WcaI
MRILHLGINYWPDQTGIAPFAAGRCEYLAARGHEVVALSAPPFYPRWRIPDEYWRRPFVREEHHGVTILRSWTYVPRSPTSLRRVMHEASFICSSLIRALGARRPDLLFVTSPPLGLAASAMVLSRLWRVPYVLHVADLQPDAAVDLGMLPRGRLIRTLYRLEAAAYREAALVSTLTEAMRRRIVAKGVAADKVALFSDWVAPELFEIALPAERPRASAEAPLVVAHFGNMGVKQGLEVMLETARLTRDDPAFRYLLVGDGAARPALEARARSLALPNLCMLPLQPHARFLELLGQADVCLVTQQRSVADIVFPSKVITLMAAGRAVLGSLSAGSEVARVLADSGSGIVVAPEQPIALVAALGRLRAEPAAVAQMGRAGREYARARWERERVLNETEQRLIAVINGDRRTIGAAAAAAARTSSALTGGK